MELRYCTESKEPNTGNSVLSYETPKGFLLTLIELPDKRCGIRFNDQVVWLKDRTSALQLAAELAAARKL